MFRLFLVRWLILRVFSHPATLPPPPNHYKTVQGKLSPKINFNDNILLEIKKASHHNCSKINQILCRCKSYLERPYFLL